LSRQPPKAEETDQSLFTEIVLDVRPEVPKSSSRFGRLA
jgi:hypothetical protein